LQYLARIDVTVAMLGQIDILNQLSDPMMFCIRSVNHHWNYFGDDNLEPNIH
jgi:hypothetical protein